MRVGGSTVAEGNQLDENRNQGDRSDNRHQDSVSFLDLISDFIQVKTPRIGAFTRWVGIGLFLYIVI